MSTSTSSPSRTRSRAYAEGWAASVLFHLFGMIGAILVTTNLKLPPQPTPITWEIAMIEPSPSEPEIVQQPEPVMQPEAVKQAKPVQQPTPKVTEPQTAVRKVQNRPVQSIAKPVTQQVRQIRQTAQPIARPIDQPKETVQTTRAAQSVQTTKVETIESQVIETKTYSASTTHAPMQTKPVVTDPTSNIVEQPVAQPQSATLTTKEAVQSNTEVASTPSREKTVIQRTPAEAGETITQEIQTVSATTTDEVQTTTKVASTAPQFIERAVIKDPSPVPVEQAVAQTQAASVITKQTIQTRTPDTTEREPSPVTREIVQSLDKSNKKSTSIIEEVVTHNINTQTTTMQSPHRPVTANAQTHHSRENYGWLAELLWNRIEQFKRYPAKARMRHWEGQVVLLATITNAGEVTTVDVVKSSGYDVLDDNAIAALRLASPLRLNQHMKESQVAVQIPINYRLGR